MKNQAIEFYRFISILIIAIFHFNIQYTGEYTWLKGGYLGVEFFFILSGFFLMMSYSKENHCKNALNFLLHKIRHLLPSYLFMMVVFFLFDIMRNKNLSVASLLIRISNEIWDLLFLQDIGIPGIFAYQGSIWFLTSLLFNSYIIYYLLLKHRQFYIEFIIPVTSIVFYGYIGKTFGSLSMQAEWIGIFYGGLLRGFLAMGIGVLTYKYTQFLKPRKLPGGVSLSFVL